jgi:nucleoside-diphosphate-sugar epimerase
MITGATGFLGMHVLYDLVSKGYRVKALFRDQDKIASVKKVFRYYRNDVSAIWDQIDWIQGDLLDFYNLMECLNGVTAVYHTAGKVSFSRRDKGNLFRVNIQGTANLVDACLELDIEKFCHVSSIATLSEPDGAEPVGEDLIWNPGGSASVYAISKLRGEMEVWRGIHEGLHAVIVNPAVIIGPGMWNGSGGHIFHKIYKGLKYYPEGSGGYVDVRDVASVMIRLTEGNHFGERFIINAENITHRSFIDQVSDAMLKPRPSVRITPFLSKTALFAETIHAAFTGIPPRISRNTFEIAAETAAYSNKKIVNTLKTDFITVEDSVKYSIPLFLAEVVSTG